MDVASNVSSVTYVRYRFTAVYYNLLLQSNENSSEINLDVTCIIYRR